MPGLSFVVVATTCILVAAVALVATLTQLNFDGASPGKRSKFADSPITFHMTDAGPAMEWNIPFPAPVIMDIQNSVNYKLNGSVADAQWAAMIPPNGGIVHLGPDKKPFMLSTFHQLRCLDIIRKSYDHDRAQGRPNPTTLSRHCMNYIRQMILCRGDTRLERVVDPDGPHAVQIRDPQTCRDWRALYSQVEKNAEANS